MLHKIAIEALDRANPDIVTGERGSTIGEREHGVLVLAQCRHEFRNGMCRRTIARGKRRLGWP